MSQAVFLAATTVMPVRPIRPAGSYDPTPNSPHNHALYSLPPTACNITEAYNTAILFAANPVDSESCFELVITCYQATLASIRQQLDGHEACR